MVVPNEKLVVGDDLQPLDRATTSAPVAASVWLPPDADLGGARVALDAVGAERVTVEEITPEGVRLELRTAPEATRTRAGGEEAALRERRTSALREAGLLQERLPEPVARTGRPGESPRASYPFLRA